MKTSEELTADKLLIREAIESWVIWRDSGQWDRFRSLWHPDGWMRATWFEAPAQDFIVRSKAAFESGMKVLHGTGAVTIDILGDRAISQTRMHIMQRAMLHGNLVDVTCHGRFWDAWEEVGGEWKLLLRQPIYELDNMQPVGGAGLPELDPALLSSFPEGYRHLAYLQTQLGMNVNPKMPGTRGPEVERLAKAGADWLAGGEREALFKPLHLD